MSDKQDSHKPSEDAEDSISVKNLGSQVSDENINSINFDNMKVQRSSTIIGKGSQRQSRVSNDNQPLFIKNIQQNDIFKSKLIEGSESSGLYEKRSKVSSDKKNSSSEQKSSKKNEKLRQSNALYDPDQQINTINDIYQKAYSDGSDKEDSTYQQNLDKLNDDKLFLLSRIRGSYKKPYQIMDSLRQTNDPKKDFLMEQEQCYDPYFYITLSILVFPFLLWPLLFLSVPEPDSQTGFSSRSIAMYFLFHLAFTILIATNVILQRRQNQNDLQQNQLVKYVMKNLLSQYEIREIDRAEALQHKKKLENEYDQNANDEYQQQKQIDRIFELRLEKERIEKIQAQQDKALEALLEVTDKNLFPSRINIFQK